MKVSTSIITLMTSTALAACTAPPAEQADLGTGGSIASIPTGGATSSSTGGAPSGGNSSGGGAATGGAVVSPQWEQVWADEFDGDGALDTTKWNFETKPAGWVNNELQAYQGSRAENVRKESGSLILEARRDFFGGTEYSSARIFTGDKAKFLYGRFEARAKLPTSKGSWPAIWMMPIDIFKHATTCSAATGWIDGCDAWPASGEIDIMEHVGFDVGQVHATIHCKAYNWQQPEQATTQTTVADVDGTFHVYAMEWSPEKIEMFVDDKKYFSYANPNTGASTWPFDQPFYFILNIAVGGTWGGQQGVDPAQFPARMEVDYVRAFKRL